MTRTAAACYGRVMSVDTLSLAKELRAAELAPPQAAAIAAAIGRAVVETSATKADLLQVEEHLTARIDRQGGELRTEVARLETKVETAVSRLLFWLIDLFVGVGGLIVAATKLLPAQG